MRVDDWLGHPTDFAEAGLRPAEAFQVVLELLDRTAGGEDSAPDPPAGLIRPAVEEWLAGVPLEPVNFVAHEAGYETTARLCGRIALEHYRAHPGDVFVTERWLWQMLESRIREVFTQEVMPSLFQWGWGINAARYVLGWEPMPNPALHRRERGMVVLAITCDHYGDFLAHPEAYTN